MWAPWRLEYVGQADEQNGCIFCRAVGAGDEPGLVVHRGSKAFALLNKYPYASGHLMVAPYRHVGEFSELDDEEALEIHRLASQGMGALAQLYGPQGFNLGWNLGRIAGAGVTDHVHLHLVPTVGGRHELHARAGRRQGAAGAPRRDSTQARRDLACLRLKRRLEPADGERAACPSPTPHFRTSTTGPPRGFASASAAGSNGT